MTDTVQKIKEIDGKQLYQSFLAGAQKIFDHQKLLNKINVFPVADADTGTNLASTMRSIIDAIIPTENPKQAAVALADAALTGARGNSGIIFAQFLYGFSNEITTNQPLDVQSFAESIKKAVAYAYDAIANPVEGTILTVIKEWAEYIYVLKDRIDDFIKLLVEAYNKALEALSATTLKLETLARAHVVDAGAKGFVFWLEGIKDFFILGSNQAKTVPVATTQQAETQVEMPHDLITFRFCTEALISGKQLDKHKIRNYIQHCGDSLVVAGIPEKVRVHIHTDFPAEVFAQLRNFGSITYQKVDDMVMQNEIQNNRKSSIALVTDSTSDLPKEILDRYQIHVVPLSVHFGDTYFLDRLTIQPPQFYSMLETSEIKASSAQPASKEFQNKYDYLATHYDSILGIQISGAMSGTFSSSDKGAKSVVERSGKRIDVFDSKTVTGALGLIVLRIAQSIEAGATHEELIPKINEWISKTMIRVSVTTLKYIVRSGRVSPLKSFIGRALDLKPVITVNKQGTSEMLSKYFTERGCMEKIISGLEKITSVQKVWGYAITHANNKPTASWYASEMKRMTGLDPVFIDNASPALVANTGSGVVCISLLFE